MPNDALQSRTDLRVQITGTQQSDWCDSSTTDASKQVATAVCCTIQVACIERERERAVVWRVTHLYTLDWLGACCGAVVGSMACIVEQRCELQQCGRHHCSSVGQSSKATITVCTSK
jgi:hypothetical protein